MRLTDGNVTFQWFLDHEQDKNPPLPGLKHGTLEEHRAFLRQLNQRGAGIYFTVNETDLKGRRKEHITRVRAYMIDCDGITKPQDKTKKLRQIYNSPLKPSLIIETRNGLHVYWYSTGEEAVDADDYRRVNGRLAHHLGGDMKARDISRVMRVPGFLHQKDPSQPVEVKIVREFPDNVYTREQLLEAFAPYPGEEEELEQARQAALPPEPINLERGTDQVRNYVLGALEGECRELATTQQGSRNDRLNRAAFRVGQLLHTGGVSEEEARDALRSAAKQTGLADHEIDATIQSGFRGGRANPRTPQLKEPTPKRDAPRQGERRRFVRKEART